MKFGDRIKITNVGCYGGLLGTFVKYEDRGATAVVKLDELGTGEIRFVVKMVEAVEK